MAGTWVPSPGSSGWKPGVPARIDREHTGHRWSRSGIGDSSADRGIRRHAQQGAPLLSPLRRSAIAKLSAAPRHWDNKPRRFHSLWPRPCCRTAMSRSNMHAGAGCLSIIRNARLVPILLFYQLITSRHDGASLHSAFHLQAVRVRYVETEQGSTKRACSAAPASRPGSTSGTPWRRRVACRGKSSRQSGSESPAARSCRRADHSARARPTARAASSPPISAARTAVSASVSLSHRYVHGSES